MRELDIALGRFVDARYDQLDASSRAAFDRLLDATDADIYSWLLGAEPPPDDLSSLVERIRSLVPADNPSPPGRAGHD